MATKRPMAEGRRDMRTLAPTKHHILVEALRQRVLDGKGESDIELRRSAAAAGAGDVPVPEDQIEGLAKQIGEAAYRVSDDEVSDLVAVAGGQKAAFEIIAAAALGAGLMRWNRAMALLDPVRE
jgi:hypothetical protein